MRRFHVAPILAAVLFAGPAFGQDGANRDDLPIVLRQQRIPRTVTPAFRAQPGKKSPQEWRTAIDSTWGAGLPTAQKLQLFDAFWRTIDEQFVAFQDLDVDWDALRARYRPEVQGGVSQGRFAAIMNHLARALRESHTQVNDGQVSFQTTLLPGVPLMMVGGWAENRHFGACLTPQPDSSLLAYDVVADHPLGLEPGDRVLGYDGERWATLYRDLLKAELPLSGTWWGSSPSSYEHSFLMGAGMNWHLFETIDVVKHATGDTLSLSVTPLAARPTTPTIFCSEQLDIPGVPKPDVFSGSNASVGIIDGTRIGYIYVQSWTGSVGQEFLQAVRTVMFENDTVGLIIDFRLNFGGNMFLSNDALEVLFNEAVETIAFVVRSDPDDHLAMMPSPTGPAASYVIQGNPATFYDRPIAVLVGPGALSSGDQVALRMTFHPMARTFGKSTATAFNAPAGVTLAGGGALPTDWFGRFARADAHLVSDPDNYLTHDEFPVDEPVWLEPDDIARGIDTVVEAAKAWIEQTTPVATDDVEAPTTQLAPNYPNPFRKQTTIAFEVPATQRTTLTVYDLLGREVAVLLDGLMPAGTHRVRFDGETLAPGVYFYRMRTGVFVETREMIVVR